jgi:GNAT superfamily N-acetyltransferase
MGRNNADFAGITTEHTVYPNGALVTATHPEHGEMGYMELSTVNRRGNREVLNLEVGEQHRRKGIATALWRHAIDNELSPEHSTWRTDEGDSWANSIGGDIPPRMVD